MALQSALMRHALKQHAQQESVAGLIRFVAVGTRAGLARATVTAMLAIGYCASAPAAETTTRQDVLWLNRISYGADAAMLKNYRTLGRSRFLETQLHVRDVELPATVTSQFARLRISDTNANAPERRLEFVKAENRRINGLIDAKIRSVERKKLNEQANTLLHEAVSRHLLHAIYSPAQLHEQLVWFWLNHFSVFQGKSDIRWLIADYEAAAIRPHALGKFRELVLATLRHPAMLQYLDNAQNAAGHVNENYARELMELHTLGLHAGYTQHDVQALARILTGAGINATGKAPKLKPAWRTLYRRDGAFEFNPARHDFGAKLLLGEKIAGGGFEEIEHAVDILVAQPACARFVSSKLGEYFLGSAPPEILLQQLVTEFARTDGDIAAVLRTLLESREFAESLGKQFKDPMHFVISSLRIAYEGKVIVNTNIIAKWLNALGEPLYGVQTPDGYPLDERSWASSGQLIRRFEIAREIGAGGGNLFQPQESAGENSTRVPQLVPHFDYDLIEPLLGDRTKAALDLAKSQEERNAYLLSSPEFNYR